MVEGEKKFWSVAAAFLILPGGLILAAALGALIAIVMAAVIYAALIFHGIAWCGRKLAQRARAVFRKAEKRRTEAGGSSIGQRDPLPELVHKAEPACPVGRRDMTIFDGRPSVRGKWTQ